MFDRKAFLEKAVQMTKPHIGKRTAFWFDIDFVEFKLFNSLYGLEEGNRLLAAAQEYINGLPGVVLCQRIFSDEFVFLMVGDEPRTDEEMIAAANAYVEAFLAAQQQNYPACTLKLSCGICPVFSPVPMEAIDNASLARKRSRKSDTRTAVMFTQTMLDAMENHRKLEAEIALAMQERRFVFYLQPKVELKTGRIIGAEALARQLSPTGEVVYPNNFMPIMEENESIVELDLLILELVCEHLAKRIQNGMPVVCTSVNLSRLHIQFPHTAKRIHAIVQKYGVPCELLEFELTETVFLDELTGAKSLLDQLREYGYSTSIDDFGAGYAGLNLCQEVDFDIIKLDRRFLTDEARIKKKNEAIIPCIVDMMQRINVRVLCEGVERADQCEFLLHAGCHLVQGYYFSKPVPPEQFYQIYEEKKGHYTVSHQSGDSNR